MAKPIIKTVTVEAESEEDARQIIEALASERIRVIEMERMRDPLQSADPKDLPDVQSPGTGAGWSPGVTPLPRSYNFKVKFDVRMAFQGDAESVLEKALSHFPTPSSDPTDS